MAGSSVWAFSRSPTTALALVIGLLLADDSCHGTDLNPREDIRDCLRYSSAAVSDHIGVHRVTRVSADTPHGPAAKCLQHVVSVFAKLSPGPPPLGSRRRLPQADLWQGASWQCQRAWIVEEPGEDHVGDMRPLI